jgi:hypothetical protein
MATKQQIVKSAEGYPLLGWCLYWSVSNFKVAHSKLLQVLDDVGIDKDFAKEPRAKAALTRAMREVSKEHKGTFSRKVVDDKEKTLFALVDSTIDAANEDVNFTTATKASLGKGKDKEKLHIDGSNAKAVKDNFEHFRKTYTSDQFTGMVKRFLFGTCEAISVRDSGGVYFIPTHKKAEYQKLVKLFDHFQSCSLDIIPIIDSKEAKKSMWKSLVGRVEGEIENMHEELKRLPTDKDPRAGVIDYKMERFQALREKVENYKDLLEGTAGKLQDDLNQLGKALGKWVK